MFPKKFRAWKFQFEKYLSLNILRTLVFHVDAPNLDSSCGDFILFYEGFFKRANDFQALIVIFYTTKILLQYNKLSLYTPGARLLNCKLWIFQYRTYKHVWWFSDQNRCKASAMFPTSCLKSDPLTFKNNLTLVMKFSKRKELM